MSVGRRTAAGYAHGEVTVSLGIEDVSRSNVGDAHQRIVGRGLVLISERSCLRQAGKLTA